MVALDVSAASSEQSPQPSLPGTATAHSSRFKYNTSGHHDDQDENGQASSASTALYPDQRPLLSHGHHSKASSSHASRRKRQHRHYTQYSSSSSPSSSSTRPHYPITSLFLGILGWLWWWVNQGYNRITGWLFPQEPEPLDLQSSLFFIAQVPFLFWVALTWIPSFVVWLVGFRTSQARDHGQGQGMRKSWSVRLALALSFLRVYLQHAKHLTIEACQNRSRSIPFMTAPVGIRVNRVKIPAFPYRSRAEAIVMECLTEEERKLMPSSLRRNNALHHDQDRDQAQARRSMFSVKVQQDSSNHLGLGMEMNSIHGGGARRSSSSSNSSDESRSGYSSDGDRQEDQFAEGLDAEWLEYIGPEDGNDTIGAKDNSSNVAAILYLHGGGYYTGSKEEHRVLIGPLVKRLGRNIRILTVNYRLAPQHPFPAALIDALSCYMWLLEQPVSETFSLANDSNSLGQGLSDTYFQPNQIVFMGDSAGGGLALSLSLLLRDYGRLPQPLTIATWSPWMDLTQSLPSFKNNALTDCIPYENYVHQHSDAVDRIFEDEYDGGESGMDGDDPEEFGVETGRRPKGPRQRAQVYCPDSCLRIKYVSPMFETNFRGIPSVFITCGSAERFVDECVLMAARLEAQQQPCRIDLHEDMPHIFPLFRFHPSATAALDRTSAYIRKVVSDAYSAVDNEGSSMTAVDAGAVVGRIEGDVIIPISPSSSSHSSSAANSPLLSSSSKGWFEDQQQQVNSPSLTMILEQGNSQAVQSRKAAIRRVDSSSSMSSSSSSSSDMSEESLSTVASSSSQLPRSSASASKVHKQALLASSNSSRKQSAVLETDTTGPTTKSRTIVNVVDLSGTSVMSYHKQTRPGSSYNEPDLSLDVEGRRRRHPPSQRKTGLTLEDVVSDATLFEWEILLKQGYIPTRYWPYPPHRKA